MESLPPELISFIQQVRPLFRAEVFDSFCYLMMGLLIGDAKQGTVRSSVFAPAGFWPQRLSDLFCRHKLSHQAFMARLTERALLHLYTIRTAKALVLDCRFDAYREALRQTDRFRRLVSSHPASHRTCQAPRGTLLCLCSPSLSACY
jgi:hypothetical protein